MTERIEAYEKEQAHQFILAFWQMMKEFWEPSDDTTYWDSLLVRSRQLAEQFPDRRYDKIIIGFVDAVDEVQKYKEVKNARS